MATARFYARDYIVTTLACASTRIRPFLQIIITIVIDAKVNSGAWDSVVVGRE